MYIIPYFASPSLCLFPSFSCISSCYTLSVVCMNIFFFLLFPDICKSHIWTQLQSMHFYPYLSRIITTPVPVMQSVDSHWADKLMQIGWLGQTDPSHRLTYNFNPLIPRLVLCLACAATLTFFFFPQCVHTPLITLRDFLCGVGGGLFAHFPRVVVPDSSPVLTHKLSALIRLKCPVVRSEAVTVIPAHKTLLALLLLSVSCVCE